MSVIDFGKITVGVVLGALVAVVVEEFGHLFAASFIGEEVEFNSFALGVVPTSVASDATGPGLFAAAVGGVLSVAIVTYVVTRLIPEDPGPFSVAFSGILVLFTAMAVLRYTVLAHLNGTYDATQAYTTSLLGGALTAVVLAVLFTQCGRRYVRKL